MSRRREPRDAPDSERQAQRRFWNSPRGWALSAVAVAALVGLSLLSTVASLAVVALLVVAELADHARRWAGAWLVEATASGGPRPDIAWRVAGLRRSRQVVDEVAGALERGQTSLDPPGAERVFGPK
ncbi:MAG: hypothetical protein ACRDNI_08305 [Gaiellaceae bacterium]